MLVACACLKISIRAKSPAETVLNLKPVNSLLTVTFNCMAFAFGINGLLQTPRMAIRERGGLSNTSTTILSTEDGQTFKVVDWNNTSYLNKAQNDTTTI